MDRKLLIIFLQHQNQVRSAFFFNIFQKRLFFNYMLVRAMSNIYLSLYKSECFLIPIKLKFDVRPVMQVLLLIYFLKLVVFRKRTNN